MNALKVIGLITLLNISLYSTDPIIENATTTTIVVIDGKALLVDLDAEGQVTTTYMEVQGYFDSSKEHKTKVQEAKAHYIKMSASQMDQIRFISLTEEGWELDEFMVSNIGALANHYKNTYANQIEIVVARNRTTETQIERNISMIKQMLVAKGVASQDIKVEYKVDLGEEPTRFIKVVSNLKSLVQ